MYAVKISSSGKFICYCDNCWYETSGTTPIYLFSKERANEIAQQMRNHYVYKVEIISEDGTVEIKDAFKKNNPMMESKPKTFGKIRIRL